MPATRARDALMNGAPTARTAPASSVVELRAHVRRGLRTLGAHAPGEQSDHDQDESEGDGSPRTGNSATCCRASRTPRTATAGGPA